MPQINKTPNEYQKMVKNAHPSDSKVKNFISAYVIGGLICVVGEIITNILTAQGLALNEAGPLMSVSMIFIGGLLTGIGVYDEIAQYAGAGTIVPITGFANAIVSPAMEYKQDGYILGLGAKMYSVAGPVLTYGMLSAFIVGIIKLIFI
ncbi:MULTISPECIES: stage V sporulation protein AC [unclassified Candidatus Frackibacter]|uniref:stage V sporulation protein AC n=1 Tax=unclassified Candidatus Frackibacter TaxID=2648818 RepID=UPI00079ABA01|nr:MULTISPECIES: stage V sporulation protein AC [unclassified Candidatus Frackibacter]KXS43672.1 MAG: stage V sporulation protein AC [Candidatus Frackibacter sp. T328-2]SDC01809.1 stage V sporulation protein AC [Candidatus Frackibacter sp. WG11]SEM33008.1 stage V sporulation protein AC [Candidatus Frackibacter sp. WG12]SFL38006.1 stage V sporulation protein AC [Candidatus Frackibacter sp. WG13]